MSEIVTLDGHKAEVLSRFSSPWTPDTMTVLWLDGPFKGLKMDVPA